MFEAEKIVSVKGGEVFGVLRSRKEISVFGVK